MKKALRSLLERIARGLIFRRSLPADGGGARVSVSPDAQLKYLRGSFDSAERPLLDQARALAFPAAKVWDIGANVGVFAFAAVGLAGSSGKVLAVEADPWLFSLLQRSRTEPAARNDLMARIDLLCTAVADQKRIARFSIAARGRAANVLYGFGSTQTGGSREAIMVGQVTLDNILDASFPPV